jgi:type IV pilus assembly protein PilB
MRKRLGEILVEAGLLDQARLGQALAEQQRWGGPLGRILIDMGLVPEEAMVRALSEQLGLRSVDLDVVTIEPKVRDLIDAEFAEQNRVIPIRIQNGVLDVVVGDAPNLGIVEELKVRTHLEVRPVVAGPKAIERALARHYGRGGARAEISELRALHMTAAPAPAPAEAPPPVKPPPAAAAPDLTREVRALQARMQQIEALVGRDEDVLRHLLALFIEKGLVTREEILERIK